MFIVNQTYISLTFTTDDSLWVTGAVALTIAARTIDVVRYTIQLHIYNIVLRYTSDNFYVKCNGYVDVFYILGSHFSIPNLYFKSV